VWRVCQPALLSSQSRLLSVNVNIVLTVAATLLLSFRNFFLSLIVFTVFCLLSGLVRVGLGQVVGVGGVVVGSATATATTVVDLTPDIIFILL